MLRLVVFVSSSACRAQQTRWSQTMSVGVTMQLGEETMAHLKTIKRSLRNLRVPVKRIK